MTNSNIRRQPGLASPLFALLAAVLLSAPAAATSFTVHGYELGERVTLTSGRQVWTAQLDASLDDVHGISFCVDVDKYIGVGSFHVRDVLDPYTASSPPLETPRDFAFAGSVMDNYGYDVGMLTGGAVTRTQAITGVQAAIWDGIYGGGVVQLSSLSPGARSTYDTVMAGTRSGHTERAVIVEMSRRQDQVFSNPIPEPGAALVFALGAVIVRGAANRRRLV